MNQKGQVSFETLLGVVIFLFFFIGIVTFTTNQSYVLNQERDELVKKDSCSLLSQAFTDAKNNKIKWSGHLDYNTFIKNSTIFMDYNGMGNFSGIYCETIDTNISGQVITIGDLNLRYDYKSGFIIQQ